ncbi:MAG: hypothetical protein QOC94_4778, partial [Actinoplanes sp.]|nr:hypothetical protein [Actinoplanes sp.]
SHHANPWAADLYDEHRAGTLGDPPPDQAPAAGQPVQSCDRTSPPGRL